MADGDDGERFDLNIFSAAFYGDIERLKELVSRYGTDVDRVDEDGFTALHHAVLHGREDAVRILLDAKADVEGGSASSATPLHRASARGHDHLVSLLLSRGASIDAVDHSFRDGRTALHKAAAGGHISVCRVLLEHGASTSIRDSKGRTPKECALASNQIDTARLLGASPSELETIVSSSKSDHLPNKSSSTLVSPASQIPSHAPIGGGCPECGAIVLVMVRRPFNQEGLVCESCFKTLSRRKC